MSDEGNTPAAAASPQCQFFVQRKKRLCRMTVKPGRQYCGEHQPQPDAEGVQTDKRIPCPNDPKHTCYASKLLKHLAICNARLTEQPPYIIHNINAPEAVESCPRLPLSSYPKDALANVIDKVNHLYAKHVEGHITAEPPQAIHRAVLPEFNEAHRTESSRRHLRQVSALLRAAEQAGLVTPRTCYVELGAGKGQLSYYAAHAWCGGTGSRVLSVDRAPLRHKRDNKLRSAPPTSRRDDIHGDHTLNDDRVSGDGLQDQQESYITGAASESHDRMDAANDSAVPNSKRFKSDKSSERTDAIAKSNGVYDNGNGETHENKEGGREGGSEVGVRIRADLAHLALEAVPVVVECDAVVGLAKHLCGVATDYALRCIAAPGVVLRTRGLVLATCCHHRIERALYVASEQLQDLGVNAEEFNIMLGIVSWATSGDGRSRERRLQDATEAQEEADRRQDEAGRRQEEADRRQDEAGRKQEEADRRQDEAGRRQEEAGRKQEEREETGRRAKALLDWGRVLWLRRRGFEARLCRYVPRDVSLENVAVVAVKR